MDKYLHFDSREEFRLWLEENSMTSNGVWLLFGKPGGPRTIKANEALEEALCFGWIDGQMQSLDDKTYVKYFSLRRKVSNWSDKNKMLAEKLEQQGRMTGYGRVKVAEAKKNGKWDAKTAVKVTDEQIAVLSDLLREHKIAHANFLAMAPSVKKTYTRAYFSAKTDSGRAGRLLWMIERLHKNLKPM